MDAEENQKQVFPRRPQPLEIAARFPHSHRRDEAVEVENQKQVFPLSTATGWLFRPNSERRPGGGASLLLQAHCSIRKCSPKGHPVLVGKIAKPPLLIPDSLLLAVA